MCKGTSLLRTVRGPARPRPPGLAGFRLRVRLAGGGGGQAGWSRTVDVAAILSSSSIPPAPPAPQPRDGQVGQVALCPPGRVNDVTLSCCWHAQESSRRIHSGPHTQPGGSHVNLPSAGGSVQHPLYQPRPHSARAAIRSPTGSEPHAWGRGGWCPCRLALDLPPGQALAASAAGAVCSGASCPLMVWTPTEPWVMELARGGVAGQVPTPGLPLAGR